MTSNLCCVLDSVVHCKACGDRWCSSCWSKSIRAGKELHAGSPRVCSLTKKVIGVSENRYYPTEPGVGLVFSPIP